MQPNNQVLYIGRGIVALGIICLLITAFTWQVNAFLPSMLICCLGLITEAVATAPLYGDDEQPIPPVTAITYEENPTKADFRRWTATKNRIFLRWVMKGHEIQSATPNLRLQAAYRSVGMSPYLMPHTAENLRLSKCFQFTFHEATPRLWPHRRMNF